MMSVASEETRNLNFIEHYLTKIILQHNEDLRESEIVNVKVASSSQFDGFMSSLYFLEMTLRKSCESTPLTHKMIVKLVQGEERLQTEANAAALCLNELYIYKTVIPKFKTFLNEPIDSDIWVPKAYFVDYKIIEGLSDTEEAVLVMDNLMVQKFRSGPKILNDEAHLMLMIKNIAKFHAASYAMKIKDKKIFDELIDGLVPYSFLASDGSELEVYHTYYKSALNRLITCILSDKKLCAKREFFESVKRVKQAVYDHPLRVMENFLCNHGPFSVILHGDYNQTNVLFKYESEDGFDNPQDIRMIDFQETKHGTAVIDIACFMYINMSASHRVSLWDKLIEVYHETVIESLTKALKCERDDEKLEPYSFENFNQHFKEKAFYGLMSAISSLPMLMCSDDESQRIEQLYDDDFQSPELQQLSKTCGGKEVDERIKGIFMHAYEKEYLKIFE